MKFSFPVSCEWLITEQCNMKCFFCSACSSGNKTEHTYSDRELEIIINNIKKSGCLYISLSGGEPLLHKQFFEILSLLRKNSFIVTLTSNGTLITESIVNKLCDLGLKWVQVTLLSSNPEIHDKIMGVGSFNKIINAIKLLKKTNIGVTICYTKTIDYNDEINIKKIAGELNTEIIIRNMLKVGSNAEIINKIHLQEFKLQPINRNSFAILPDGRLKTCSESNIVFGNIFVDDISDMWNDRKGFGKCLKNNNLCLAELSWKNQEAAQLQLEMVCK